MISANSSHFPGQTKHSNVVSLGHANYRNDMDNWFFFFFSWTWMCSRSAAERGFSSDSWPPRSHTPGLSLNLCHHPIVLPCVPVSNTSVSISLLMQMTICTFGISAAYTSLSTRSTPQTAFPLSQITTIVSALNFPELVNYGWYKIFTMWYSATVGRGS